MKSCLTFIIPIRHPDNAQNPEMAKLYLQKTLASISAQTMASWQCVVVANHGTVLPDMPNQCRVCHVDFPPNNKHTKQELNRDEFYDAFRTDKGKRVLAGMLFASDTDYFMIVDDDDDDFVYRELCEFVTKNSRGNGWYFKNGYVWGGEGSNLIFRHSDFNHICGTSHIIRSDLFNLPDNLQNPDMRYVRSMLGSHYYIEEILTKKSTPLAALPFVGAIYRVANINAHSQSAGILKKYIFKKSLLKHPKAFFKNCFSLRILTKGIKIDFWCLVLRL